MRTDVAVVGGGLSGLACALEIARAGAEVTLLEASRGVGGRARTDEVEGFRLDRGFQVLLTAYPEARRVLDYEALELRPFRAGALVRAAGAFHRVTDPRRDPAGLIESVRAPVGGLPDKLRVARLAARLRNASVDEIFAAPEHPARAALAELGFADRMVERFWRPFLGGVFLDPDLGTSSRMLAFVLRCFATGESAVPARGMGEMARQLAARLPEGAIRRNARVGRVEPGRVTLEDRRTVRADAVVLATDGVEAARLLGGLRRVAYRPTACLYFAAPSPPVDEGILVLNGEGRGPVNHLAVMSRVAPEYAPRGWELVSANVVDPREVTAYDLEARVRTQMEGWFGSDVRMWRRLRTYRIERGLPDQSPAAGGVRTRRVRIHPGLYVCGDHRTHGSIQGALVSGRLAADSVLADLGSVRRSPGTAAAGGKPSGERVVAVGGPRGPGLTDPARRADSRPAASATR